MNKNEFQSGAVSNLNKLSELSALEENYITATLTLAYELTLGDIHSSF